MPCMTARDGANKDDVERALLAYETELFPRSTSSAAESEANQEKLFGEHAPQVSWTSSPNMRQSRTGLRKLMPRSGAAWLAGDPCVLVSQCL